jgi:hypothetical protein
MDEMDLVLTYKKGNRVYGTETEESDWDFTVVVTDACAGTLVPRIVKDNVDANVYTVSEFRALVVDGTKFQST